MAPVCSPTAIICVTMPGNTCESFSGSVSDLPSSSDVRTLTNACSTTALPAVLAVMSKPSRIGTPLEIKVPSVRVKRATAIFLIRMPSTGSFNMIESSTSLPPGVPYHAFRPTIPPPANCEQEHEANPASDQIAQAHDDSSGQRQRYSQASKQRRENGNDFPQQQNH